MIGRGGERRLATSDQRSNSGQNRGGGGRTRLWIIIALINCYKLPDTHWHSFLFQMHISFLDYLYLFSPSTRVYTHTVTVLWPGQVIVLSYQTWPLCQSPWYDPNLHPFLFTCAHPRGQSMVRLRSGDSENTRPSAVSRYGHCWRRRVRDAFHSKLWCNNVKFFATLFSTFASGGTEYANRFLWKWICSR